MTAIASKQAPTSLVPTYVSAIRTENLTKQYGQHVGVQGVNLTVEQGEVFGYLGPNGAGKTTTVQGPLIDGSAGGSCPEASVRGHEQA